MNVKSLRRDLIKSYNELSTRLVPASGTAPTVAGEIVRAISAIDFHFQNSGRYINVGRNRATCNAPARYLMTHTTKEINKLIEELFSVNKSLYATQLIQVECKILDYLISNPSLQLQVNRDDMLNYVNIDDFDRCDKDC